MSSVRQSQRSLEAPLSSPRKKTGRPATVSRTGQDPSPRTFQFQTERAMRIHFSIILPDVPPSFHALHREIALPMDWNAKGSIGWSRTSPQFLALASLSNVACCCCCCCLLLDALIPCHAMPCHAMPLADVLMLMTDARRGARPCACACFAGNSSSDYELCPALLLSHSPLLCGCLVAHLRSSLTHGTRRRIGTLDCLGVLTAHTHGNRDCGRS
jgi:hypothetical protein